MIERALQSIIMYLIYFIICAILVHPVLCNRSITSQEGSTSPGIPARVYSAATNLLPPDDEVPPVQPIAPVNPETPSTSSGIINTIWELLPGGSGFMGAVSPGFGGMGSGLVSPPSRLPQQSSVVGGIVNWFLGKSEDSDSEDEKKSKKK